MKLFLILHLGILAFAFVVFVVGASFVKSMTLKEWGLIVLTGFLACTLGASLGVFVFHTHFKNPPARISN